MMTAWWLFVASMLAVLYVASENSAFCLDRGYAVSRIALGTRSCVAVVNGTYIVVERGALR